MRRSSRPSVRARGRSSSTPATRPARTTASSGRTRQCSPSSSTRMRPGLVARNAVTRAIPLSLRRGGGLLVGLDDLRHRACHHRLGLGDEASRDGLLGRRLRLDAGQDLLDDVRVLFEERGRVLAALAEPLVAVAEVRARLLDDLPLERRVEDRALPGNSLAVDDVELGLLERRRDLVLRDLDADAVADRLDAVLQRLDAADVEADRRVELQRASAWCCLRRAEHHAYLL